MGASAAPTRPAPPGSSTPNPSMRRTALVTIVWDDPVNLMNYVTFIFQKLFGYSNRTPPS